METAALALFTAVLIISIACGIPVVIALIAGYGIFFAYALRKGFRAPDVLKMSLSGIRDARNILMAFLLIGMLTALWRAAGTIPSIVCYSFAIVRPSWFLLAAFLINSLISFLTGTSFGSVATMGVICMTMGNAIGVSPVLSGGAILSGIYFGDRCSPVSTSALLVADITKTDIFRNIGGMMRTGAVPFAMAAIIYALLSLMQEVTADSSGSLIALFHENFRIGIIPVIPALIMLILSALRMNTRATMAASILAAAVIAAAYEGISISRLPRLLLFGYQTQNDELAAVISGGGIISMVNVGAIVAISSSYAGIFAATGMLARLKESIKAIGSRIPRSLVIIGISVLTVMISCNQTLSTMLTKELCSGLYDDDSSLALALENSTIVIAPLIPWSIACSVPLSVLGAPAVSIFAAFYLFLLPIAMIVREIRR